MWALLLGLWVYLKAIIEKESQRKLQAALFCCCFEEKILTVVTLQTINKTRQFIALFIHG